MSSRQREIQRQRSPPHSGRLAWVQKLEQKNSCSKYNKSATVITFLLIAIKTYITAPFHTFLFLFWIYYWDFNPVDIIIVHLTQINNCLCIQAGQQKGCAILQMWNKDICNHFWYCCKTADTYEEFIVSIFFDIFFHFQYLEREEIEASLFIN